MIPLRLQLIIAVHVCETKVLEDVKKIKKNICKFSKEIVVNAIVEYTVL